MPSKITVIQARKGVSLQELWGYRELLYFLIWRDVKVRYKQATFGIAWAVLQPMMMMIVFTIFLGRLAGIPSEGVPYPVFSFVALVPWTLFSQSVTSATTSLVSNANLVSKIYFPRVLLPSSTIGAFTLDFAIASILSFVLVIGYGLDLSLRVLALPGLAVLTVLAALSIGIFLSAFNARYRDVQYVVPFMVQMWLFLSPVAYPSSLVEAEWARILYFINPMAGIIDGFRWALLPDQPAPRLGLLVSVGVVLLSFIPSLRYFRTVERTIADVI